MDERREGWMREGQRGREGRRDKGKDRWREGRRMRRAERGETREERAERGQGRRDNRMDKRKTMYLHSCQTRSCRRVCSSGTDTKLNWVWGCSEPEACSTREGSSFAMSKLLRWVLIHNAS